MAERIVGVDDRHPLHIRVLLEEIDDIGDELGDRIAVRSEVVARSVLQEELMRIAVPGDRRHLELGGERRECEAVARRERRDHRLDRIALSEPAVFGDHALRALRLVDEGRRDRHAADPSLGIDLLDDELRPLLAGQPVGRGRTGEEGEDTEAEGGRLVGRVGGGRRGERGREQEGAKCRQSHDEIPVGVAR